MGSNQGARFFGLTERAGPRRTRSVFYSGPSELAGQRGVTTFELLLFTVFLVCGIAALIPVMLASRKTALEMECSLRLAVIQEAKRDVMSEMNILLPRDYKVGITDKVNDLHLDKIAFLTTRSPWRFHPEDPCPMGGTLSVGTTFLDPPSCSMGLPIANFDDFKEAEPEE